MRRRARPVAAAAAVLAVAVVAACRGDVASPARDALTVAEALRSGDASGFERAAAPPRLAFPRDHGPHPSFRTEWWYWTANVATPDGRPFGVQLVFFRQALAPPGDVAPRAGALAASELVLAHAALGDVAGGTFHHAERLQRHDGVRAIVAGPPLRLCCGDWTATAAPGGDGLLPIELAATFDGVAFRLRLLPDKPLVLQGDAGLSVKSSEPGNASIYYSLPRLQAEGEVTLQGVPFAVAGRAWCDREWSTSALGDGQVGWDWFSLQLDDRTELMWYRLRRQDGGEDPHSQGLFVRADGTTERLLPGDVDATPQGTWTSGDGRAGYPLPWRLAVPRLRLDLLVEPRLADQELHGLVRYWEGAVTARGTRAGAPVAGVGFLEMTGYTRAASDR